VFWSPKGGASSEIKIFTIGFDEGLPNRRNIIFVQASIDGAGFDTECAINAVHRVDEKLPAGVVGVDTVYRANINASPILYPNTRFTDDMCHCFSS
jgi:hypothetical protein